MPRPLKLGILATHPVQYYAPLYRRLADDPRLDLTVFFAHRPTAEEQGVDFGVAFEWDVDTVGGFKHEWLHNVAREPSASDFNGCDTPEVRSAVRAGEFDAFLLMGWHARTYWQGMRACWAAGVSTLVRGDSQLAHDPGMKRIAKRAIYPLFMRRFAACISVGTRSEEYFRHYGARRVLRSPHFVDNAFFADAASSLAPKRDAIRARWGIPADAFVAGFAGKLIEKKRPLDLIRAAARSGRRDLWVLIAGDGELRAECEREARALGVNATFTGFLNQTQIPRAYVAADVLVLPSDARETWGLVVNEAMASGRPALVSTSVGCSPDLVLEGVTGYGFALGDVAALAAQLDRLAGDRALAAKMGEAARRHVASFDVAAAAEGVVEAALIAQAEWRGAA